MLKILNTLIRILRFTKGDWILVSWLFKQMLFLFFIKGDPDGAKESLFWIKMHCFYYSKKIDNNNEDNDDKLTN